ncbi:MAG: hypothetical protein PUG30_02170 [Actinomycetaceae bacterium]|nr:hypothetical protein [Actinomycetaceae bacterium]
MYSHKGGVLPVLVCLEAAGASMADVVIEIGTSSFRRSNRDA